MLLISAFHGVLDIGLVHCGTMKKLLLAFCSIALGMANAQAAPPTTTLRRS